MENIENCIISEYSSPTLIFFLFGINWFGIFKLHSINPKQECPHKKITFKQTGLTYIN